MYVITYLYNHKLEIVSIKNSILSLQDPNYKGKMVSLPSSFYRKITDLRKSIKSRTPEYIPSWPGNLFGGDGSEWDIILNGLRENMLR